MAVRIRLRRMGRKKQPHYRVVVADSASPRDGKFVESLGYYKPLSEPARLVLNLERVDYWVAQGATPSHTVRNLVDKARRGGDESLALGEPDLEAERKARQEALAAARKADAEAGAEAEKEPKATGKKAEAAAAKAEADAEAPKAEVQEDAPAEEESAEVETQAPEAKADAAEVEEGDASADGEEAEDEKKDD